MWGNLLWVQRKVGRCIHRTAARIWAWLTLKQIFETRIRPVSGEESGRARTGQDRTSKGSTRTTPCYVMCCKERVLRHTSHLSRHSAYKTLFQENNQHKGNGQQGLGTFRSFVQWQPHSLLLYVDGYAARQHECINRALALSGNIWDLEIMLVFKSSPRCSPEYTQVYLPMSQRFSDW